MADSSLGPYLHHLVIEGDGSRREGIQVRLKVIGKSKWFGLDAYPTLEAARASAVLWRNRMLRQAGRRDLIPKS